MISKFSTRLRELRLNKGLRQEQVAKLIGVNKSAISTYENDTRQPSFEILVRLANLYRVTRIICSVRQTPAPLIYPVLQNRKLL